MDLLSTLALVALVVLAVACDLRTRRIPNALTVSGFLIALGLRLGMGWDDLLAGLAGAGMALALAFPLVVMGGLGGGDAKLLMAVGAFLGWEDLLWSLLVTALVGGGMAVVFALRRRAFGETLAHCHALVAWLARPGAPQPVRTIHTPGALAIPYGVAIGVGALAVVFRGWLA